MEPTQEHNIDLEIPKTYLDIDLSVQLPRALERCVYPINIEQFYIDWNTPLRTWILDTLIVNAGRRVCTLRESLTRKLGRTKAEIARDSRLNWHRYHQAKKNDPTSKEKERVRHMNYRQRKVQQSVEARQRSLDNLAKGRAARAAKARTASSDNESSVLNEPQPPVDPGFSNLQTNELPENKSIEYPPLK